MNMQSIKNTLKQIKEKTYTEIIKFQIEAWVSKEPLSFSSRKDGKYKKLSIGESWGEELFDCAWFRFSCSIDDEFMGKNLFALLDINGEMLVVDNEGNPVEGLTNQCSTFEPSLGKPGKISFQLSKQSEKTVEIWADAGLNDLFGMIQDDGKIIRASLVIRNDKLHQLAFDFTFLISLAESPDPDSDEFSRLGSDLTKAADILNSYSDDEVKRCSALLETHLKSRRIGEGGEDKFKISAIGHAHLDLAWLWPLRETIRKGARTFATALRSMERYPEYIFGASQPQLYDWIKHNYPSLYMRIKERVAEGRWEIQGGLWVECDTNLVSGESLIRQLLYGIRFFQKEFGIRVNNVMLPDAFGFSAALPQIMSLAGIEYFITMKPAWNLINKFPYHSFIWKGIDGSEIPVHILPEGTYNGAGTASSIKATKDNYNEAEISDHALILFGIGDGGGGPGLDHLESVRRAGDCRLLPSIKQERTDTFYSQWIKQHDSFPLWNDEIYLERHQGTFTSQAQIKKMNRRMEESLMKSELLNVISSLLTGQQKLSADRTLLEEVWKETLLYQFHDILPGSSIKRIYDEAIPRYEQNLDRLDEFVQEKYSDITQCIDTTGLKSPELFFNYTGYSRDQWISRGDSWNKIILPPFGFTVCDTDDSGPASFSSSAVESGVIENDLLKLTFSAEGWISSIVDKERDEEILSPMGKGNLLSVYQDDGDCWDFPLDYRDKLIGLPQLESSTFQIDGPYTIAKQSYSYGKSRIEQEVRLTVGSSRIDFITRADWQDEAKMLRTSFDVNVISSTARYEIQGGFIERPTHSNTSRDKAKDEVPAQRWADLSQADRGVALLNDCKYGYRIKGNTMELNLLRSGTFPHANISPGSKSSITASNTDIGTHEFTYSLFSHSSSDLQQVIREACFLNSPVESFIIPTDLNPVKTEKSEYFSDLLHSFFFTDNEGVIIQSVKFAEDDGSVIIRLSESLGVDADCALSSFWKPVSVSLCDLLEDVLEEVPVVDGRIPLKLKPFQIVTLKIDY